MFPNRLKGLRHTSNLTQVDLGKKLGVSKQSISNWENDNILPSIEMLVKIAIFFSVTTDYLLGIDRSQGNGRTIDVSALSEEQIYHIQLLVNDLTELKN